MAEEKQIVKVLDTREFPSTDPARVGKLDVIVTYQTDPYRVYMITLPKDDFSEDKLKSAIKKEMAERARLIGKELVL
jgi:hypothetical protein